MPYLESGNGHDHGAEPVTMVTRLVTLATRLVAMATGYRLRPFAIFRKGAGVATETRPVTMAMLDSSTVSTPPPHSPSLQQQFSIWLVAMATDWFPW